MAMSIGDEHIFVSNKQGTLIIVPLNSRILIIRSPKRRYPNLGLLYTKTRRGALERNPVTPRANNTPSQAPQLLRHFGYTSKPEGSVA